MNRNINPSIGVLLLLSKMNREGRESRMPMGEVLFFFEAFVFDCRFSRLVYHIVQLKYVKELGSKLLASNIDH